MNYSMSAKKVVPFLQGVWRRSRCGDSRSRNTLVETYLPLVLAAAGRMHTKLAGQVQLDDLISSGTLGLVDAIKSFDPGREVKFETYCLPRVRGAMLDELRSMDWIPRLTRSRHRKLAEAVQGLEARTGRKPTDGEIATELRIPLGKVRQMQNDSNIIGTCSLEQTISNRCDRDVHVGDTLPDRREEDPARQALRADLRDMVLQGLSRAERLVILLYYYEQMTMREIGATLGLSESRVSQMHSGLLVRLRAQYETHGASPPAAA